MVRPELLQSIADAWCTSFQISSECSEEKVNTKSVIKSEDKAPIGTLRLHRYDIFNPACAEAKLSELCLWQTQKPAAGKGTARRHVLEGGVKGAGNGEAMGPRGGCPVEALSKWPDQGLPSIRDHPLRHYQPSQRGGSVYKAMHVPELSLRVNLHYGEAVEVGEE